jgi:predicted HicB family RNase H-like nuclease
VADQARPSPLDPSLAGATIKDSAAAVTVGFYVRVPPGLKEQLRKAAARSGRTLNAETVRRLEQSLEAKP